LSERVFKAERVLKESKLAGTETIDRMLIGAESRQVFRDARRWAQQRVA